MASAQTLRMEAEARRRKVRKGTHSCWECRRRKIKCQFDSSSDTICLPCQVRGSQCQSQEYVDEAKTVPAPDRRLAQRLGRLEEMMEKLMDHMKPDASTTGSSTRSRTPSTSPPPSVHDVGEQEMDVLDRSINEDTPLGILLGIHSQGPGSKSSVAISTPGSESAAVHHVAAKRRSDRHDKISKTLHALFPAQSDIDAIIKGTSGVYFVTTLFHSRREYEAGNCESEAELRAIPPADAHPTVLARRLLQLCICMQQLSPAFNKAELNLHTSISKAMTNIMCTVGTLVASNDELIGTSEGIQSLILQGLWHSGAGNLRKAWLSNRRALSLAQLMGIDRGNTRAFESAGNTVTCPRQPATAAGVWFRILHCDRFISLLLGLPIGSYDNSFATEEALALDDQQERLVKAHTTIAARISERNSNRTAQAYTMTQEIDVDLEAAGRAMPREWWQEPALDPFASPSQMAEAVCGFIHQIHHFALLILLHLPYMLRAENLPGDASSGSRYEYSRVTCIRASREVLKRFVSFRTIINSAFACRHMDYSALIAAMTLLLSYLGNGSNTANADTTDSLPPPPRASNNVPVFPASTLSSCPFSPDNTPCNAHEDGKLVESVRERMRHVAIVNSDKLSAESADIIGQLMPVLEMRAGAGGPSEMDCLHVTVPFLGTVSIRPTTNEQQPGQHAGTGIPTAGGAVVDAGAGGVGGGGLVAPWQISIPNAGGGGGLSFGAIGASVPVEEQMDMGDFENVFVGGNNGAGAGGLDCGQFDPQMMEDVQFPGLMAGVDDWTLQGVDTTYWSMLNGGM